MEDKIIAVTGARHSSAEPVKRRSFVEQIANNQLAYTRSNSVPEYWNENQLHNIFKLDDISNGKQRNVLEAICDDLSLIPDW